MPYSINTGKAKVADEINGMIHGESFRILDLGCGSGAYAKLIRKPCVKIGVDAVDYKQRFGLDALYDEFYVHDIRDINFLKTLGIFDLVIMGDVLEHLNYQWARAVLNQIEKQSKCVLIAVPFMWKQDGRINKWEKHEQDDLTEDIFLKRYSEFKPLSIYKNYGYFVWRRTLKYVIRKVPERNTEYLERLIPEAIVYNDVNHTGAINSFVSVIKQVRDDAVYIQDDMILCNDFVRRTQEYIDRYPDEVIVFSNRTDGKRTRIANAEGFYDPKEAGWLMCTYIPKTIAIDFAQWWICGRWQRVVPSKYSRNWIQKQFDDIFFRSYLTEKGKSVFVAVPNLAGHPANKSVIDDRPPRITTNFDFENAEV